MKFADLVWGAFLYAHANMGTAGERIYDEIMSDSSFLIRLRTSPSSNDFETIRDFVAHFGVHQIPRDFADRCLSPLWPIIKPHIETLTGLNLVSVDFADQQIQKAIKGAFDWPSWVWGGDTVRSKILHFFNPDLFVMWDINISISYSGYYEFLKQMQKQAQEAIADYQKLQAISSLEVYLSDTTGYPVTRPLSKYIDQYNWITITRNWPETPPDWLLELFK